MGIRRINYEKCVKCGNCDKICPEDVLRMDEETKRPYIKYLHDCQSCFICELNCPKEAIFVSPFRERRQVLPW